jgi:hypothetical protein
MPVSHTILYSVVDDAGSQFAASQKKSAGQAIVIDESVPSPSTDLAFAISFAVGKVESIVLLSDQNLTLKTNSSGSPANTINLLANVPYVWQRSTYLVNLFTVDVTQFFLTNASGSTARLQGRVLTDPT